MTILDRLLAHDAWTTRQLIHRCGDLTEEQLHRRLEIGDRSVHETLVHIVECMENHTHFLLESTGMSHPGSSLDVLSLRLTAAAKDFAEFATRVEREGRADEMKTNPANGKRRSLGGIIAHVITHGMHHRAQLLYMMEQLGIPDAIEGDMLGWEAVARGWGWEDGGSYGRPVAG